MEFFSLSGSIATLATTRMLATALNCIGIGIQRETHTRRQRVTNIARPVQDQDALLRLRLHRAKRMFGRETASAR